MNAYTRSPSHQSTCTVLTCTSEEFEDTFQNDSLDTDILCEDVLKNTIQGRFSEALVAADTRFQLDKLLEGMLLYAPSPSGKRYVAVALHIAHRKGGTAVVDLAEAWMERLLLPMMAVSAKAIKRIPSSSQTLTLEKTAQTIEPATRSGRAVFRDALCKLEKHRCALIGAVDQKYVNKLVAEGQTAPDAPQSILEAAHIIPFSLNNCKTNTSAEF